MRAAIGVRVYALVLGLTALGLLVPGLFLVKAGGSAYYVVTGALLLASSVMLALRRAHGLTLLGVALLGTLLWSLYEGGFEFWPLVPRLTLLGILGLVPLVPLMHRPLLPDTTRRQGLLLLCIVLGSMLVVTAATYVSFASGLSVSPAEFASRDRQPAHTARTDTNWVAYGGSRKGTRYSPADQVTRDNVNQLALAWSFRTGVATTFKNTPLQVNDKLYVCAGGNVIIALDADAGTEVWRFDAAVSDEVKQRATYFTTTCRGVSYHEAPPDYAGECPRRILMGTTDARLLAVDADTGETCTSFGNSGQVDLTDRMGEVKPAFYFVTSAPAIVAGNAVVGGWVLDNYEIKEPSGAIRAFDAITGQFAWAWDMGRPGNPGEPGEGEVYTRGTPNVWSLFSVDEARGMVFAPLGNETPDYFGGLRHKASEKYASSVVALNGATGELIWSFQTTHHDIWDYDVPSQPVLVDVADRDGVMEPALVQATKRGEVFLLNRLTGKPMAQVEEVAVPQGAAKGDWTAPTQPYSALPNVLRKGVTEADMWGVTPFDQIECRVRFRGMRYEGDFTPPTTAPGFQFPGNAGGYNWGSVTVDEERQVMVGNMMTMGNYTRLIPRAEMEAGERGSPQLGTPYGMQTYMFVSSLGIPCTEPPFGMLVAIDLQQQDLLWQRPIGDASEMAGLPIHVGTPNMGGAITTVGGLTFFGGTMDNTFRALDTETGKVLWQYKLPQTAHATPMTYISPGGRQFVVLTVPAGPARGRAAATATGDGKGGHVMAFALPATP